MRPILFAVLFITTSFSFGQYKSVTISGVVKSITMQAPLPYVNMLLLTEKDTTFISGTVTNEEGRFTLANVKPGNYLLEFSFVGYLPVKKTLYVA